SPRYRIASASCWMDGCAACGRWPTRPTSKNGSCRWHERIAMRALGVLLRKELLGTFGSPIGYTVAAVFLLVLGYTFSLTLFATKVANLIYIFHQMYVLTILLVPALTMRAFAEERRTDTLELLLTAPVGEVWIVLAKFLAVLALVLAMYAGTLSYAVILE